VRLKQFQTSFVSGQISTKLQTRTTQPIYENGALEITNGELLMQGGVLRRPGTKRLATVPGEQCRIEGHVYSRHEAYLLAFQPGRLDIFTSEGNFVREVTGQPWNATTMWTMTVKRWGNFTFICDQTFRPQFLLRRSVGDFVMSAWSFDNKHPLYKYAPDTDRMEIVNLEANPLVLRTPDDPLFFQPIHVGRLFDFFGATIEITAVQNHTYPGSVEGRQATGVFTADSRFRHLDPNPFTVVNGSNRVTMIMVSHGMTQGQTFTIENAAALAGLNLNGTRTVLEVIDEDRFAFTGPGNASTTQSIPSETGGGPSVRVRTRGPTRIWAEPVFSPVRGWPQAVEFHQGRLYFAGGPQLGDAIFGSRVRGLFDFDPGEGGEDEGVVMIAETQTNAIRHLVSAGDLLVFGDEGEAFIPSSDEGISQATARGLSQSALGSAFVAPLKYDGAVLFCDVMGQHVYEFIYSEQLAAYVPTPISGLCPELIVEPLQSATYKGSPRNQTPVCLWVMSDGSIAVFASRRAEGSAGWVRWVTQGDFQSVAALNERLYCAVRREIDGEMETVIEEFAGNGYTIPDGCFELEAAGPTREWVSPFGEGVEIDVVDLDTGAFLGREMGGTAGEFTMAIDAQRIAVGLPFTTRIETLPPALQLPDGPSFGEVQRIAKVISQFHETAYARIDGEEVVNRLASDMLGPLELHTGGIQTRQMGFRRGPTVTVECDVPVPFCLLGMLVEVMT
jgi:hypothetical protein